MLSSAYRSTPQPAGIRAARRLGVATGGRSSRSFAYIGGGVEPTLDEVMADPIVHRLMARDGVALDSLNSLIAEVRGRLL
ncbi:hypothetical protein [Magnetospirillum sp. 15-1]|uniref:hypothetical protein n=1 Tax=Magnetospirillum sp. 15-1 TaxID=1979370 RepID=UPI001142779D|nr:hypothetical protein [Magnetospirillum sp. 15-1]